MNNGLFFECNLSNADLFHIHDEVRAEYYFTFRHIEDRMKKLQEALEMCQDLNGETFAYYAKVLFDGSFDRFERMTAEELALYVRLVSDGCELLPERIEWPNAETVVDTAFVQEGEWEAIRHLGIGGSDAAAVLGLSHWTTQRGLFYDKTATPKVEQEEDDEMEEPVFARGHFIEPRVVEAFCNMMGAKKIPESRMFRSRKYPNVLANIDAIVDVPGQGLCIFEAKTTILNNRDIWETQIPLYYVPQMRNYAGVLDDDRIQGVHIGCIFVDDISIDKKYVGSGYNVDRSIFHFLPADKTKQDEQIKTLQEWWDKYVAEEEVPARSGNAEMDLEDIRTYEAVPDPLSEELNLSDEARDLAKRYLAVQEQKKEIEKMTESMTTEMDMLKVELVSYLGEHEAASLDLGGDQFLTVQNKRTKGRETTDTKLLKTKYPEIYEEVVSRGKDSFRFSVAIKTRKPKGKKQAA